MDSILPESFQKQIPFVLKTIISNQSYVDLILNYDKQDKQTDVTDKLVQQIMSKFEFQSPSKVQSGTQKIQRLYADGVFDVTHSGHYNALRQAKQFCETLVVGVVSTEEVLKCKGSIPILSQEERVQLAKSCKWADEVIDGTPYFPNLSTLVKYNCSHIAHGDDFVLNPDGTDSYQEFKDAGKMVIFKRTEGISTTDIVGRLLTMDKQGYKGQKETDIQNYTDSKGQKASSFDQDLSEKLKFDPQEIENIQKITKQRLQILNTTKRIRQFSQHNKIPSDDDKIVYVSGSFDVLHVGHINFLSEAKKQGTYLIVGIHTDQDVAKYKGENYPILSIQERVLSVLAQKAVDEVLIGSPVDVDQKLINQFHIQVVCEGKLHCELSQEYFSENDCFKIPKQLGIYKQVLSNSTFTQETLIERILVNKEKYLENYRKKAQKAEQITSDVNVKEV